MSFYIRKKRFLPCRRRRYSCRRPHRIVIFRAKLIALVIILIIAAAVCDALAKPVIMDNASERADAAISNIVYDSAYAALSDSRFSSAKFVNVSYNSSGAVRTVECDTVLLNMFSIAVNNGIEDRLKKDNSGSVQIHMGALIGSPSSMNRGPLLTYKYDLSTDVNCSVISEFSSSGINQTKHTVLLRVSVKTRIMIPWCTSSRDVVNDFPIAETIIVGQVPDSITTLDLTDKMLYNSSNE